MRGGKWLMNEKTLELIKQEVYKLGLSGADRDDFVQEICLRFVLDKPEKITRSYIRRAAKWILLKQYRADSRRPQLVFDNKDYPYEGVYLDPLDSLDAEIQEEENVLLARII
jgi:DNA-directed RNA polymerase specialized sigma24 family protein